MKKTILMIIFACVSLNANAESDIRAQKGFVATCPEKYLTYIDKAEGGPGAYCNCPDTKISYIDKAEGGPGFYCASTSKPAQKKDIRTQKKFISSCPEKYLTYIDKAEGGPGAYCDCPTDKISYLDKAEGGRGAYCAQ
jgi:hypothetical protein